MNPKLHQNINSLKERLSSIAPERMEHLEVLLDLIQTDLNQLGNCQIICICTHNSRRSHIAQAMLAFLSNQLEIKGIEVFSGGIEVTEVHENAIKAFKEFGFEIHSSLEKTNPKYSLQWGDGVDERQDNLFSKIYDDPFNPSKDFIAMMVCSDVEKNCPMVKGTKKIVSMNYSDPKFADGSADAVNVYLDKIHEIGSEMLYVLQKIKN